MRISILIGILSSLLFFQCGNNKENANQFSFGDSSSGSLIMEDPPSKRIALDNKGVGPIENLHLAETINEKLVISGELIYKEKCIICHKPTEKFIGPAPQGILDRRSPEWVMNMILNPDKMIQEDSLAKDLFMEFNGSPMTNQNLTRQEARAILEYFRTL